jgi:hypothetical protein
MVAVSETDLALPRGLPIASVEDEPVEGRRVVAVAVTPMELLRPGSDLVRMIAGAGYVDLLLACEDEPVADPSPVCRLGRAWATDGSDLDRYGADGPPRWTDDEYAEDEADDSDDDVDDLLASANLLGLDELHLHRLALPAPLGAAAEPDLVAALSELVGFDPEPGVQVLAPASLPGDPQRAVIERAVLQIVQVYGLPLQRFRCLELSVVDDS